MYLTVHLFGLVSVASPGSIHGFGHVAEKWSLHGDSVASPVSIHGFGHVAEKWSLHGDWWFSPGSLYCKVPKFSDARKLRCNLPKIQTNRPNLSVFRQKDTDGIGNSEDPDQTAPLGAV